MPLSGLVRAFKGTTSLCKLLEKRDYRNAVGDQCQIGPAGLILHDSLELCLVELEHLLEEGHALLGPDLVDPDEVVGRGQLEVLALLVHLVRDLAGRQVGAVEALTEREREKRYY